MRRNEYFTMRMLFGRNIDPDLNGPYVPMDHHKAWNNVDACETELCFNSMNNFNDQMTPPVLWNFLIKFYHQLTET